MFCLCRQTTKKRQIQKFNSGSSLRFIYSVLCIGEPRNAVRVRGPVFIPTINHNALRNTTDVRGDGVLVIELARGNMSLSDIHCCRCHGHRRRRCRCRRTNLRIQQAFTVESVYWHTVPATLALSNLALNRP